MFPLSLILLQEARLRDFQVVLLHLAGRCSLRITVIIIVIVNIIIFIIIIIIIISIIIIINMIRFINILYIFLNLNKYRAQWLHNIFFHKIAFLVYSDISVDFNRSVLDECIEKWNIN